MSWVGVTLPMCLNDTMDPGTILSIFPTNSGCRDIDTTTSLDPGCGALKHESKLTPPNLT